MNRCARTGHHHRIARGRPIRIEPVFARGEFGQERQTLDSSARGRQLDASVLHVIRSKLTCVEHRRPAIRRGRLRQGFGVPRRSSRRKLARAEAGKNALPALPEAHVYLPCWWRRCRRAGSLQRVFIGVADRAVSRVRRYSTQVSFGIGDWVAMLLSSWRRGPGTARHGNQRLIHPATQRLSHPGYPATQLPIDATQPPSTRIMAVTTTANSTA